MARVFKTPTPDSIVGFYLLNPKQTIHDIENSFISNQGEGETSSEKYSGNSLLSYSRRRTMSQYVLRVLVYALGTTVE